MTEEANVREEPPVEPVEGDALNFRVSSEEAGERLDAFLAARVSGLSRTALKRAVEEGDVLVDGRAAKPSYRLRGGEEIEVEAVAPAPAQLNLTPEDIPLTIVHEDEEIVVVDKPAGMVVHPASGVHSGTLANALAYRFQMAAGGSRNDESAADESDALVNQHSEIISPQSATPDPRPAARSPQSVRPGIVHRLDRDTSGLIVVAKTARAHESLSDQFRAREVYKSYSALVHGVVKEDRGRVEEPLGRDPRNRTRMAVVRGGRAALTLWRTRRRFARVTLLDVEIKTGRTHQIRVHMAWMKHPVVGDETYGGGRDQNVQDARLRALIAAAGRQFLHAGRLAFAHPATGERMLFEAPLPPALQNFLDELEAASGR